MNKDGRAVGGMTLGGTLTVNICGAQTCRCNSLVMAVGSRVDVAVYCYICSGPDLDRPQVSPSEL